MKKIIPIVTIFCCMLAVAGSPVSADWLIDRSGALTQVEGFVLGEDDAVTENVEREQIEKSRQNLDRQIEARQKVQEKSNQKTGYEVRSEQQRLKLTKEVRDNRGKPQDIEEVELAEDEPLHVEGEDGQLTRITPKKDGALELRQGKLKGTSELQLRVGEKNAISVTLPNGKERQVTIPDKALENLVSRGIITAREGEDNAYTLTSGKNGEPVYAVEGTVEKKLFGLFKLKFAQKLEVAASESEDGTTTSGDIVSTESRETGWRRFLERLAR